MLEPANAAQEMKDLLQSFELWQPTEDWHMYFRPKLLEHVGTRKARFPRRWKRTVCCCVLAWWQHVDIFFWLGCFSGDPFGNGTKAKNRFAATDFDIDETSSIRSSVFLPACSYFYQEFWSFSHFSVWTQQQSRQDEIWKHADIWWHNVTYAEAIL